MSAGPHLWSGTFATPVGPRPGWRLWYRGQYAEVVRHPGVPAADARVPWHVTRWARLAGRARERFLAGLTLRDPVLAWALASLTPSRLAEHPPTPRNHALARVGVPTLPAGTILKLKLSGEPETDLAVLARIAAEPRPPCLRLDLGGRYTPVTLHRLAPLLDRLPIDYLEQPLAPGREAELAHFAHRWPLALDEGLLHPGAWRHAAAWQVAVLKPARWGPPARTRRLVARLRRLGKRIVLSSLFESPGVLGAYHHLAAELASDEVHGLLPGAGFRPRRWWRLPPPGRGGV